MAKNKTHKRTRHLEGEVKRLTAEIKRLKKDPSIDKDEIEYEEPVTDIKLKKCSHCTSGYSQEILVVGKLFWKCLDCGRTIKK